MRISDWSSDVCSSDLPSIPRSCPLHYRLRLWRPHRYPASLQPRSPRQCLGAQAAWQTSRVLPPLPAPAAHLVAVGQIRGRSEEHTSELQSLMRISYAVFCLKKKKHLNSNYETT